MPQAKPDILICLLLFILGVFVFAQNLNVHGLEYRDDEIFYYKSTHAMVHTGNYLSPRYFGEDRFQKPILFYWLVVLSYKIFGMNWFAARFISVLFAGMTVWCTWVIGKNLFNRKVATLSAIILMTTPLFFRHAKNVVPDMALNFFIVWAIYCAIRFIQCSSGKASEKLSLSRAASRYSLLFFVACALGFMIKGFAALIIPFLTVILYALFNKKGRLLSEIKPGRGIFLFLLIVCPWFLYMVKVHGTAYLNYMLVDETKNRLINQGSGGVFIRMALNFFDHCLFYSGVIGSYFAPWSMFLIGALPLAIIRIKRKDRVQEGLSLMMIWFFSVFCFFCMMYFSISHYMLVLSTPLAILVSYFFLEHLHKPAWAAKMVSFLRKYLPILIVTIGMAGFSFLFVLMAGASKGWLVAFLVVYLFVIKGMITSRNLLTSPLSLGLFILFVFAQSAVMHRAGVAPHTTLQKFAATINEKAKTYPSVQTVIGVGSHDIHEKEFQVYFDQKVIKAAGSMEEETRDRLTQLFSNNNKIYCLITEKDFEKILKQSIPDTLDIVQEDYIFRRRMYIDKNFFAALMRLDQETIHSYLKEKIILVKREPRA